MKRTFLYLLLCAVCLGVNAKKVKKQTQPLWPDGTPIAEWFNDTTKVDVNTLGKKYVITEYGVKNCPIREFDVPDSMYNSPHQS